MSFKDNLTYQVENNLHLGGLRIKAIRRLTILIILEELKENHRLQCRCKIKEMDKVEHLGRFKGDRV